MWTMLRFRTYAVLSQLTISGKTFRIRKARMLDATLTSIDDSAKRGGWPTLELFTVILCGPSFSVC